MMRRWWSGLPVLGLVALLAAAPVSAFVLQYDDSDGSLRPLRWAPGWMPIHYVLNDRPFELLPNLAAGSTPLSAIQAAMDAWAVGPVRFTLDGTVSNTDSVDDHVNLITFADTPRNRQESSGGAMSAQLWFVRDGSQRRIVDCDIVVNPVDPFATDGRPDAYDLQDRLVRVLGFCLGLANSPVAADAMYPFNHLGKAPRRAPSSDDIAGVRTLYGLGLAPGEGSISGQVVTDSGAPVFGAHVAAVDADGIVRVGVLSAREGQFTIPSLPAGLYQVYAEPLDGPMTPANLGHEYQLVRLQFQTAFAGGNRTPAAVMVSAGQRTAVDPIRVAAQEAPVRLEAISGSPDGHTFTPAYPQALPVHPGESAYLEIAGGKGLAHVDPANLSISGGEIALDSKSVQRGTSSDGTPYLILPLTVRPDAPPGARSLYLTQGDQRAVLTGCIEVTAP